MVGNEGMGFAVDGLERDRIPPNIVRQLDGANIYDPDEVVVQLRAIAREYDELETLGLGETGFLNIRSMGVITIKKHGCLCPAREKQSFERAFTFLMTSTMSFIFAPKTVKGR